MERIEAELLIPGGGEPVSDGVVIIDGPVISYAGPASQAPATPAAVVHRTGTVMLANGAELAHLVRHGMTPLQAIDAGHRHRPADPRPTSTQVRPAGTRLRCRRHHH